LYERKQGQCILRYCLEYYLAEVEKIMKNHSQDNCLEEVWITYFPNARYLLPSNEENNSLDYLNITVFYEGYARHDYYDLTISLHFVQRSQSGSPQR
jgi:hypothetical protein